MATDFDSFRDLALDTVAASLSVTVYYDGTLHDVRDAVGAFYLRYLDRCSSELKWFADTDSDRIAGFRTDIARAPLGRLSDPTLSSENYAWATHGGTERDSASALLFEAESFHRVKYKSYVRAAFPIDWFTSDFGPFVASVVELLEEAPFAHGYAGLALNVSIDHGKQELVMSTLVPLATRFAGFEVDMPSRTARFMSDGIKGVNWLTFFADRFLEKLGGLDSLKAKLPEAGRVRAIVGGVLIQAGDAPSAGDVEAGDRLPLYRAVAKATKPIRAAKQPTLGWDQGRFDAAQTALWLRRLDS